MSLTVGAYSFVLVAEPSLANTPYAKSGQVSAQVTAQYASYAKELRRELRKLRLRLQSSKYRLKVAFLDFYTLQERMVSSPSKYGLNKAVISQSCLEGAYGPGEIKECTDSSAYLWWDEVSDAGLVHNTRKSEMFC